MTYHKIHVPSGWFSFFNAQSSTTTDNSIIVRSLQDSKVTQDVIQENTHLIFSMHCTAIFLTSWSAYVKSSSSKACSGSSLAMGHVWSRICIWKHYIDIKFFFNWHFTADVHLYILKRLFLAFHQHHHHLHVSVLHVENWAVGSLTPFALTKG